MIITLSLPDTLAALNSHVVITDIFHYQYVQQNKKRRTALLLSTSSYILTTILNQIVLYVGFYIMYTQAHVGKYYTACLHVTNIINII